MPTKTDRRLRRPGPRGGLLTTPPPRPRATVPPRSPWRRPGAQGAARPLPPRGAPASSSPPPARRRRVRAARPRDFATLLGALAATTSSSRRSERSCPPTRRTASATGLLRGARAPDKCPGRDRARLGQTPGPEERLQGRGGPEGALRERGGPQGDPGGGALPPRPRPARQGRSKTWPTGRRRSTSPGGRGEGGGCVPFRWIEPPPALGRASGALGAAALGCAPPERPSPRGRSSAPSRTGRHPGGRGPLHGPRPATSPRGRRGSPRAPRRGRGGPRGSQRGARPTPAPLPGAQRAGEAGDEGRPSVRGGRRRRARLQPETGPEWARAACEAGPTLAGALRGGERGRGKARPCAHWPRNPSDGRAVQRRNDGGGGIKE